MARSNSGLRGKLERRLAERREDGEAGFTLIELLVVLLIIGILLAIAIPTYLTVVKSANNTAATSNLQTADTAADVYYTQNSASYTGLLTPGGAASDLNQQGSGLIYVSGVSTSAKDISIVIDNGGQSLVMASEASGNRCYVIIDNKAGVTGTSTTGIPTAQDATGTWYGYYSTPSAGCTVSGDSAVAASGSPGAFQLTGFPS